MKNLTYAEARTRNFQSRKLEKEHAKVKKITSIFFIFLFISLFFYPGLFATAAGEIIPEPNAGEKDLLKKFIEFDKMYAKRQAGTQFSGKEWENMGDKFSVEGLTLFGDSYIFSKIGTNFILRANLIAGECYLFASQEYFKKKQKKLFLNFYEKGINILEKVIVEADKIAKRMNKPKSEIIYLPSYSKPIRKAFNHYVFHELKGYDTIGTGFKGDLGVIRREVTYDIRTYHTLEKFKEVFKPYNKVTQISTTETARNLLSHFCPWGREMFFFMKEAELCKDLDFRILRPFSGYKPTPLEQIVKGLKEFPDAVMGRPVESQDKIPPVISESVLKTPQIPKHIFDEMNLIIGENGKGYLDTDKKRPIEWAWVEKEPTYTIWYTSPTVFDWQPSDYLWLWFTAVKLYFNPMGAIVDEVLTQLTNGIGSIYGQESDIYFSAKVVFEANDKGIFTTNFIDKGEWLSAAAVTRKIASFAFSAAEKQIIQDRAEGIDPSKFSMGKTYNGTKIPPIIIRAEVFGFEKVPEDEYPRTIKAVRFYLLFPENIAHKGPYQGYDLQNNLIFGNVLDMSDLHRKGQYLMEQNRFQADGTTPEPVRKLSWNKLPDEPLATFEVITDFAPLKQDFVFHLNKETSQAISKEDTVYAELWTLDPENQTRYARENLRHKYPMSGSKKYISFSLYNKKISDIVELFEKLFVKPLVRTSARIRGDEMDNYSERIAQRREAMRKGETGINLIDIKSQYQLKLRVNDKYASKIYHVNLEKGRKSQRKITGNRTSPKPGVIHLDYKPEIEIIVAKTKKERVVPGKVRKDQDRE